LARVPRAGALLFSAPARGGAGGRRFRWVGGALPRQIDREEKPMGQVLVAHTEGDGDIAARVLAALRAEKLDAVLVDGAPNAKADKARFDAADALVVVWSPRAAAEPGLRREALAAGARGALALARVGGAPAPAAFRATPAVAVAPAGRGPTRLARALAAHLAKTPKRTRPMTADPARNEASTWKGALLLAVLLAGVAWSAAWVSLGSSPAPMLLALFKG
jgi:hypothetical protein